MNLNPNSHHRVSVENNIIFQLRRCGSNDQEQQVRAKCNQCHPASGGVFFLSLLVCGRVERAGSRVLVQVRVALVCYLSGTTVVVEPWSFFVLGWELTSS